MESYMYLRDLALLLMVSRLLEILLQRYRLSKIVPCILTGLILGPCLTGIVADSDFISACAKLGAVLLVFDAGLSTRIIHLRKVPRPVLYIAGLGALFSVLSGALIYMIFYGFGPLGSENLLKGLFIGIILCSTSLYSLKRLQKQIARVWDTVFTAVILNNLLVMVVLTLTLGVKTSGLSLILILFRAVMLVVLGYASGLLIRLVLRFLSQNRFRIQNSSLFYIAFCMIMAYFSDRYFGLPDITGAYIAGIAVNTLNGESSLQTKDIGFYSFFTSLFFMGVGLCVTLASVDLRLIVFSLAMIVFGLPAKSAGSMSGALLGKVNTQDSILISAAMISGAELSLIAVWKGIDAGLLGTSFMIPIICLVFGALFIIPNVLKRI